MLFPCSAAAGFAASATARFFDAAKETTRHSRRRTAKCLRRSPQTCQRRAYLLSKCLPLRRHTSLRRPGFTIGCSALMLRSHTAAQRAASRWPTLIAPLCSFLNSVPLEFSAMLPILLRGCWLSYALFDADGRCMRRLLLSSAKATMSKTLYFPRLPAGQAAGRRLGIFRCRAAMLPPRLPAPMRDDSRCFYAASEFLMGALIATRPCSALERLYAYFMPIFCPAPAGVEVRRYATPPFPFKSRRLSRDISFSCLCSPPSCFCHA